MPRGGDATPKGTPEEMHAQDFGRAKAHLAQLTPASAVELMQTFPVGLLEMYLLAEENTRAHPMILKAFPKPGAKARSRYLPAVNEISATVGA